MRLAIHSPETSHSHCFFTCLSSACFIWTFPHSWRTPPSLSVTYSRFPSRSPTYINYSSLHSSQAMLTNNTGNNLDLLNWTLDNYFGTFTEHTNTNYGSFWHNNIFGTYEHFGLVTTRHLRFIMVMRKIITVIIWMQITQREIIHTDHMNVISN